MAQALAHRCLLAFAAWEGSRGGLMEGRDDGSTPLPLEQSLSCLLGVLRWSLSALDGDQHGALHMGVIPSLGSKVFEQASRLLILLARIAGFASTYDQVARVLLSWIPKLSGQPALDRVLHLITEVCPSETACNLVSREEVEAFACLTHALEQAKQHQQMEND